MEKLMNKCCDKIETFAGLKCSTSDLLQMVIPLKFKRKQLKVFYGFDWVNIVIIRKTIVIYQLSMTGYRIYIRSNF